MVEFTLTSQPRIEYTEAEKIERSRSLVIEYPNEIFHHYPLSVAKVLVLVWSSNLLLLETIRLSQDLDSKVFSQVLGLDTWSMTP
jgi:hypothetical protein